MVDKSKLSKDVEEQIQSLASDVYIQVEEKITNLIAAAVKAEIIQTTDKQSKNSLEKERILTSDINSLKQELAEKQVDADVNRQHFQVELTQNSINYTETIERLEKDIVNLKRQETQQQDKKQSNTHKLEDRLLEIEQNLTDKTQEVYGLNGRIMVLTEQEHSLTKQLTVAKEQIKLSEKQQNEAVTAIKAEASAKQQVDALTEKIQLSEKQQNETVIAIKAQAEASAKQQIDALTGKLQLFEKESAQIQAEALQSSASKIKALEQKIAQLAEQAQQEQNGKAELQQQFSAQQKSINTEQDKNKQAEQKSQDYQAQIIKLTEQAASDKQQLLDEIKSINEGTEKIKQLHLDEIKAINGSGEQVKQLQAAAQQSISELEKANEQLSQKVGTEQKEIKLYQQEVTVLNQQVKIAQEGHENILQRFNSDREKQEEENNNVRETIKFLRDENHQLISDNGELKAQFSDQINELEQKATEYRLKFEYAQKQLTK